MLIVKNFCCFICYILKNFENKMIYNFFVVLYFLKNGVYVYIYMCIYLFYVYLYLFLFLRIYACRAYA